MLNEKSCLFNLLIAVIVGLVVAVVVLTATVRTNTRRIWELYGYMDTAQKAIIQLQEISTRYLENEMEVIENAY